MDFYNKAASVLDRLDSRKGSLKGIVFEVAGWNDAKWKTKKRSDDDARRGQRWEEVDEGDDRGAEV